MSDLGVIAYSAGAVLLAVIAWRQSVRASRALLVARRQAEIIAEQHEFAKSATSRMHCAVIAMHEVRAALALGDGYALRSALDRVIEALSQ